MTRGSNDVWEAWRSALWSRFLRLDSASQDDGFFGHIDPVVPGSNRLTRVHSTVQVTERTAAHLRGDPQDDVLFALQIEGQGGIEQGGRQTRLRPGDFACYLTDRPYRLAFDGPFRQIILRLPQERLACQITGLGGVTARRFDGQRGAGLLVRGFLQQMAENGPLLSDADLEEAEDVTARLLANAIRQGLAGDSTEETLRLERIKRSIERGLRDPAINLAAIAAREGISLRGLQRLFQAAGTTPSQWIADQRLRGIAGDLRDPAQRRRSITDLALSWGMTDPSQFSRAFRKQFGMTARAWRGAD
ncbi:helix-turn-helix domain-containing protein [Phaeovulum sp. W22_SRMD_FR3]|uniref:AraC-like ligand-binding domain-containing protein n=1 Tax=Phaeovulum sp. W22_SRMD_FR3 TaxID=3240274 RepID=UPI003F974C24